VAPAALLAVARLVVARGVAAEPEAVVVAATTPT